MTSREVNVILREGLPVIQGKFPSLGEGTQNKNHLATAALQDFRKFKTLINLGEFFQSWTLNPGLQKFWVSVLLLSCIPRFSVGNCKENTLLFVVFV